MSYPDYRLDLCSDWSDSQMKIVVSLYYNLIPPMAKLTGFVGRDNTFGILLGPAKLRQLAKHLTKLADIIEPPRTDREVLLALAEALEKANE